MTAYKQTKIEEIEVPLDVKIPEMPYIFDEVSLAFALGIRCKTLWSLLLGREKNYKCFSIPKKNSTGKILKYRKIQEPLKPLKNVHTVINGLLSHVPLPDNVGAYIPRKKCTETALKHVGKSAIIRTDITNFFNSTRRVWIRDFFIEKVGYSYYVSDIFATLCTCVQTYKDRKTGEEKKVLFLPQGSPLSGSLANHVAWFRFGERIDNYLKGLDPGWQFTIYSDDIAISHPDDVPKKDIDTIMETVISFVQDAGYKINLKKTRVLRSSKPQVILGCTVNEKLNIQRKKYNEVKCIIHNCIEHGFESQAIRRGQPCADALLTQLRGELQWFKQIRKDRYEKLAQELNKALQKWLPAVKEMKIC